VFDAIEMFDDAEGVARLRRYADFDDGAPPLVGFWRSSDIDNRY
jgi:hypothetical protein